MNLFFDESGNMGRDGRYFTIACVACKNDKQLNNALSRAELKTKRQFPYFKRFQEVKASDSNPVIKDYYLRKIASKEVEIRYIVADLENVKSRLKEDSNLLYNYMLHFLITPYARIPNVNHLNIVLDNRTIRVQSVNSFADYIKIKMQYEFQCRYSINVKYMESQNSYGIQAADFIANAVQTKYQYDYGYYYSLFENKVVQRELFPRAYFGTSKVLTINR
ncbi:hypothetical protein J27TS7_11160 [Paenibacillus dendritiformis]|uniref:DUF3800 domain-containing protein n=2 Tax=Paenibacillus dendritiformis TaxID=130049 RepID=UPI001B119E59|nr:DUF3800 domain-containing protein [Paenibacillus dendritiformis]GIO71602.1 hypothetical protein J27TS7_11160 [Paenibacillus dendritiformis]